MGEVVVSCEDMDVRTDNQTDKDNVAEAESMEADRRNKEGSSSGVGIKWEGFFPKMMLRVLLVEADDSTRQIIAALLRKCCYRVAAVPDGLKAWEILKERPHNVDLILAEVELPSISGFALLTLIMEHEICKKIPVIMMSSHDSISTVYKCMMRGAADYLVKPLRKNELRNLWQHVWRRQTSAYVRNGLQDESVEEKVEVTSENETASNHSTGYVAGLKRNDKNFEKGSDAQSSCTKVDFEVGSIYKRDMQESLQPRQGKAFLNDLKLQKDEPHVNLCRRLVMHENEARGLTAGCCVNGDLPITLSMGFEPNKDRLSPNIVSEACDNKDFLANPSRDVTAFDHSHNKYPDYNKRSSPSTVATNKFDSSLHLDLSLRRCHPNDFEGCGAEGWATLRQSSASAFTRYTYRPLPTVKPKSSSNCDQQKESGSNPEQSMFDVGIIATSCTSNTRNPMSSMQKSNTSLPLITSQSNHSEIAKSCCPEMAIPLPVSVKDLRFNNQCRGYGSLLSPNFCTQVGPSPSPSPTLVTHPESIFAKKTFYPLNFENHNLEQLNQHHIVNIATNQKIENMGQKLESAENQGHISPATDHSANSSLCGGNATQLHSVGYTSTCGSNSNVDQVGIAKVTSEGKNEETLFSQGGDSHRSSQREAALTKFRLKRKDRCFEKKVRYESRKKLAEQRPRVKGQFVRRVYTDPLPAETNGNASNS